MVTDRTEYNRRYYNKNRLKKIQASAIWRIKNKDAQLKYNREYHITHKKEKKEYYLKNKEHLLKTQREWRKNNRAWINERQSYKRKNNINIRLIENLRSRVRSAIKNNRKCTKTTELIGCTTEELITHIEKQFQPDMTWDNYGKWHIDHIVPCALFDQSDPEEQKKCFHFSNMRPMWAFDNISKGCKLLDSDLI